MEKDLRTGRTPLLEQLPRDNFLMDSLTRLPLEDDEEMGDDDSRLRMTLGDEDVGLLLSSRLLLSSGLEDDDASSVLDGDVKVSDLTAMMMITQDEIQIYFKKKI